MGSPTAVPPPLPRDVIDVVAAALAKFVDSLPRPIEPEGMNADAAGAFLGIAVSKVHDLNDRGLMPSPVLLGDGRCNRWLRSELLAWLRAGAPSRARWSSMREHAMRGDL